MFKLGGGVGGVTGMLRVVALVAGLSTALPAIAGEMTAGEARQFVVEKLFSYTCFDGTRGMARVHADGSVDGSIQPSCRTNALRYDASWYIAGRGRTSLRVAAPRDTPAMLLFGTDERRKLPRFDCRIELRLLRLHTGAHHVGELKRARLTASAVDF